MSVTVLYDDRTATVEGRTADDALWLAPSALHTATGWKLETEGLCKGDACVRVDDSWLTTEGEVNLAAFATHMGQPRVVDGDVHAFGESVSTRRDALFSGVAPDFSLPDLDGRMHALADFRGKKVFMYSWGSY